MVCKNISKAGKHLVVPAKKSGKWHMSAVGRGL